MVDFRMPSLGADMEAGTLVEWLVKPGDRVKRGDVVAVVETQKGAIEIEIFEAGKIEQILVDLEHQGAGRDPAGANSNRTRRTAWRSRSRCAAGSAGRPARGCRLSVRGTRCAAIATSPSRQASRRAREYRQPRGGSPRRTGSISRR